MVLLVVDRIEVFHLWDCASADWGWSAAGLCGRWLCGVALGMVRDGGCMSTVSNVKVGMCANLWVLV